MRFNDVMFPSLILPVMANLLLMGMPIYLAELRSRGIDRRYATLPLRGRHFVIALLLYTLALVMAASMIIVLVVAVRDGVRSELWNPRFLTVMAGSIVLAGCGCGGGAHDNENDRACRRSPARRLLAHSGACSSRTGARPDDPAPQTADGHHRAPAPRGARNTGSRQRRRQRSMDIVELDRLHPGRSGCPSLDKGGIGNLAPHAVGHLRRTTAGRQLPGLGPWLMANSLVGLIALALALRAGGFSRKRRSAGGR